MTIVRIDIKMGRQRKEDRFRFEMYKGWDVYG